MGIAQPKISKRGSIFRSSGTASSPDLATQIKKAKETRATVPPPHVTHDVPQSAYPTRYPPPPPTTPSQSVGTARLNGLPPGAASPYDIKTFSRELNGSTEGLDRSTKTRSMTHGSPGAMASVAERSNRPRESPMEGSKVSQRAEHQSG